MFFPIRFVPSQMDIYMWMLPMARSRIWITSSNMYFCYRSPESQKPRQRVSNADRKVFANPESFCDKFIIGWRISGYFAIQNIQIICKVSGWTGKFPGDLKSVGMNWKVSIWCKKCPDNLKNVSGYSKKGLDDVEMYLENLEGSGWSRKCPLNSENCTDNLKRVRMIKKYAWVIWISYKCTLWSIFGPLLCLKFANTLFTRICREFEKWCNLRV